MMWKKEQENSDTKLAVYGVNDVEIPQFTIVEYRTVVTEEKLSTGINSIHYMYY